MDKTSRYTIKRIFFPSEMVQQAMQVCEKQNCSFSDLAKEAVVRALEDLHSEAVQEEHRRSHP